MNVPSVGALSGAVSELLSTAPASLTVYKSIVEPKPPVDGSGRVKAYAVFHPGAGDTDRGSLDSQPGQLLWGFQVTCVGGNHDYLGFAVDKVRQLLDGSTLTVAGTKVGRLQPPTGYRGPPAYTDPDVTPQRLVLPLQYQVLAVSA